jgi:alpha-tubulin suppressor-like RCC1 family protein
VATVNGSTGLVTVVGVGTTTMTATQASTTNYLGAEVAVIFEVLPPRVVPTVGALSIAAARVGDTAFQVTSPVSSSSGSFTYASSNPAVATVTATGSISPIAIGTTTITATQAATTSHSSVVRTATFRVVESTRARRVKKIAMSDQSGYLLSSNGTLFRASHGGYAKQSHWNETYSDVFAGREICAITTGGALKCAANVWASMVGVAGFETDVQQVSVGYQATCAIKFGGELRCWGSNGQGQVGNGTTVTQPTPVTILNGVSSVSAGFYHSCAIMLDTTLRCWGANWSGQLGDGTFTQRNSPVVVPGLTGVTSVATNFESTCVVASGGVKCWGGNYYGELGTSTGSLTYSTSPVTPDGLTSGQGSVSSGGRTTCALSVGGAVNCWGMNRFGSVGDGTYVNRFSPVAIAVLQSGVLSVAIGNESNCAVTDDYLQFCWGGNYSGQLANGRRNNLPSPTWGLIGDLSSGA